MTEQPDSIEFLKAQQRKAIRDEAAAAALAAGLTPEDLLHEVEPTANIDVPLETREDLTRKRVLQRDDISADLLHRNVTDDARQDESDARQNRTDTKISVINRLVLDGLTRIEMKSDKLGERMDNLVDTTNHRLDDFRVSMDIHTRDINETVRGVTDALKRKADKDELLTSWGERILQNSIVRWVTGGLFVAVVGTVTVKAWWSAIFHWLGHMTGG